MASRELTNDHRRIIISLQYDLAGLGPACDGLQSIRYDYVRMKYGRIEKVVYTTNDPDVLLTKLVAFAKLVNTIINIDELRSEVSSDSSELIEFIEKRAKEINDMISS